MSLAIAIAGLAFLILIHEAGHFFTALAVQMRPRRFYIFFPPALVKRTWRGIEYGIGSIPLGGYVKIPGMHRPAAGDLEAHLERAIGEAPWLAEVAAPAKRALTEERLADARAALIELRAAVAKADLSAPVRRQAERGLTDVEDGLSSDAYWRAPAWKRIAVILAGPVTNLVFAVAALAVVFMIGVPVDVKSTVADVSENTPAARFLQPGDRIVAIDGRPVSSDGISRSIRSTEGRPLSVTFLRGSRRLTVETRARKEGDRYLLGFSLEPIYKSYGFSESVRLSFDETWYITSATGSALGRIFTGEGRKEVSSVVGITEASSQSLDLGFRYFLRVLAFISLSLALLNLLPLLPLDGGHVAFSLAEWIRGRAIPREAYERASAVGIALVLFLFVIGLSNDIGNLGG
jgi:regulator of sigma E protease